jgi:DNA-binding HxlR family transcriptional regulator
VVVVVSSSRTYDHYCSLARTLERVGDRWTLLIVRDLTSGPRRFTDLTDRLGGITPKTLSVRLRELVDDGIINVDRRPGRREVRYQLTTSGHALAPAIEALTIWGLRHAHRPPLPGERVHPEHLLKVFRLALSRISPPRRDLTWRFDITDDRSYTLQYDTNTWRLTDTAENEPADLVIRAHSHLWADYFLASSIDRPRRAEAITLTGTRPHRQLFERLVERVTDTVNPCSDGGWEP